MRRTTMLMFVVVAGLLFSMTGFAQGISDPNTITINADSNADGTGTVELKTRNTSRLSVGNTGSIGIGLPGDYGAPNNQGLLNFKGFENKNQLIWKAWSSDPFAPTGANFTFLGLLGPNTTGQRGMQGYYLGTNLSADEGVEFPNEGQWIDAWETYWTGGPDAPAQERWTLLRGANGVQQRVMMYYSPLYQPEKTQLEWTLNRIVFEDFHNRNIWMTFKPGIIEMLTTPEGGQPRIITDASTPLIYKGTQSYPFINEVGETEISRDTQAVRFMSNHDAIDPSSDYRFILGSGNGPEIRYRPSSGWSFMNADGKAVNLADTTRGVYRLQQNLGGSQGSYTKIGEVGPNYAGETPLAFTLVVSESGGSVYAGARRFDVLLPAFGTQGAWKEVLPAASASTLGAETGIALDVRVNGATRLTELRFRRASAISDNTAINAELRVLDRTGDFNLSTETGNDPSTVQPLPLIAAAPTVKATVIDLGDGVTISKGASAPVGPCVTGSEYRRTGGGPGVPAHYDCENSAWVAK
jgi:hypothetical protein